jgi:hypothetical protein
LFIYVLAFAALGWLLKMRVCWNDTWWSVFSGARSRNVGWRIDYFLVAKTLRPHIRRSFILPEVMGRDHCPVGIEIVGFRDCRVFVRCFVTLMRPLLQIESRRLQPQPPLSNHRRGSSFSEWPFGAPGCAVICDRAGLPILRDVHVSRDPGGECVEVNESDPVVKGRVILLGGDGGVTLPMVESGFKMFHR